jgi:hypothetical protein
LEERSCLGGLKNKNKKVKPLPKMFLKKKLQGRRPKN